MFDLTIHDHSPDVCFLCAYNAHELVDEIKAMIEKIAKDHPDWTDAYIAKVYASHVEYDPQEPGATGLHFILLGWIMSMRHEEAYKVMKGGIEIDPRDPHAIDKINELEIPEHVKKTIRETLPQVIEGMDKAITESDQYKAVVDTYAALSDGELKDPPFLLTIYPTAENGTFYQALLGPDYPEEIFKGKMQRMINDMQNDPAPENMKTKASYVVGKASRYCHMLNELVCMVFAVGYTKGIKEAKF
jgi:hypothetical protein